MKAFVSVLITASISAVFAQSVRQWEFNKDTVIEYNPYVIPSFDDTLTIRNLSTDTVKFDTGIVEIISPRRVWEMLHFTLSSRTYSVTLFGGTEGGSPQGLSRVVLLPNSSLSFFRFIVFAQLYNQQFDTLVTARVILFSGSLSDTVFVKGDNRSCCIIGIGKDVTARSQASAPNEKPHDVRGRIVKFRKNETVLKKR